MPNQTQYLNRPAPPTASDDVRHRLATELAEHHWNQLRIIAARNGAGDDNAEDLVSEALLILLDRYRGEPTIDNALPWAIVVIKHLAYRTYHRSVREPSLDAMLEDATPDLLGRLALSEDAAQVYERQELHRIRRAAMDGLKPHERLALTLKGAGLSYEEIQAQTGWTYTNVWCLISPD